MVFLSDPCDCLCSFLGWLMQYSETCIRRPHVGQKKVVSVYRGNLLMGAKSTYVTTAVGT